MKQAAPSLGQGLPPIKGKPDDGSKADIFHCFKRINDLLPNVRGLRAEKGVGQCV